MAKTNNSSTPAQGGGSTDNQNNLLSDLERSELTESRNEALKDAQSIDPSAPNYVAPVIQQHGSEEPAALLVAKDPEWVQTILDSNAAVLESNQQVIDALDAFKENSADFVKQLVKEFAKPEGSRESLEPKQVAKYVEANRDAKYEVAEGKEFRHPNDFNIKYTEGDDVSHLPLANLTRLLNSGLIVES